eukprot:343354-Amorphochlora_amoeboformis.AAC.1
MQLAVIRKNGQLGPAMALRRKSIVIGKSNKCDIKVRLPSVEDQHCQLEIDENEQVWLKSFGKTLLNAKTLGDKTKLSVGDVIDISSRKFKIIKDTRDRRTPFKGRLNKPTFRPGKEAGLPPKCVSIRTPLKSVVPTISRTETLKNQNKPVKSILKGSVQKLEPASIVTVCLRSPSDSIRHAKRNSYLSKSLSNPLESPARLRTALGTPSRVEIKTRNRLTTPQRVLSAKKMMNGTSRLSGKKTTNDTPRQSSKKTNVTPRHHGKSKLDTPQRVLSSKTAHLSTKKANVTPRNQRVAKLTTPQRVPSSKKTKGTSSQSTKKEKTTPRPQGVAKPAMKILRQTSREGQVGFQMVEKSVSKKPVVQKVTFDDLSPEEQELVKLYMLQKREMVYVDDLSPEDKKVAMRHLEHLASEQAEGVVEDDEQEDGEQSTEKKEDDFPSLSKSLNTSDADFSALNKSLESVDADFSALNRSLNESVDADFSALNKSLNESVDADFSALNQSLNESVDAEFSTFETKSPYLLDATPSVLRQESEDDVIPFQISKVSALAKKLFPSADNNEELGTASPLHEEKDSKGKKVFATPLRKAIKNYGRKTDMWNPKKKVLAMLDFISKELTICKWYFLS